MGKRGGRGKMLLQIENNVMTREEEGGLDWGVALEVVRSDWIKDRL